MPQTTGYDVKPLRRSRKWIDERQRVEDLFFWAREYRRAAREDAWRRNERQYVGNHWNELDGDDIGVDRDRITVNMSFSTVNTIVPYVTGNEPSFYVEPYLAPASKRAATYLKAWLNRTWRHHSVNGQEHLEVCDVDSLTYGDGFMQVFWEYIYRESPSNSALDPGDVAQYARIWVNRVSPWDVWIDPYADGIFNARFVAVRNEQPLSAVKSSEMYSNTADLSISDDKMAHERSDDHDSQMRQFTTEDDRDATVDLIEFYDLIENRLIVFVEGHEMPLRVVEGVRCPIFQLPNYRIPKSPYNMSELEQLWSLQQELNETRSQMVTHRARNVAKWVMRKNALTDKGVGALTSTIVGDVIEVEGNIPLEDVVRPLEMAQLGADPYQVSDLITRDIYEISGVNEYLRGATPQMTRTATEASIMETASNVKSSYKLRAVEKFLRKVGQHMLDVASEIFPQTAMSEFHMVVTGTEAQELAAVERPTDEQGNPIDPSTVTEGEMEFSDDLFEGEYEVFVETGSTEMRNPRFREEKYKDMFLILMQAAPVMMQLGQPVPNIAKVLELWLEASGVENVEAILQPMAQNPMAALGMAGGPEMGGGTPMGAPTQPGQPMPQNAQPPTQQPTPANTGMIAPQ